jgi:MFS transporter, DHA3 family, macrolide efflux protein
MNHINKEPQLFNKNFLILWHSQLISQLGSQAFAVAMLFWIKHLTGSATLMGTLLMASMIPGAILGPIGGVVADHYSRKRIIVWCDFISGVSVLLFAVLLFVLPDESNLLLVVLFVVSIIVGVAKAFFSPAVLASIPDIAPVSKVPMANSIHQSSTQLAMFIGLGLGGLLFRLLGAPFLFLLDGLSYMYAAIVQLFMVIPQGIVKKRDSLKSRIHELKDSIIEGFAYIGNDKGMLKTFVLASVLNFFLAPILVALPFYVEDMLNVRSDWYGYLFSGYGAGAIVGYLLVGVIKVKNKFRGYLIGFFLISVSLFNYILGLTETPFLALLIVFVYGILTGYVNVSMINQLQLTSKPEMRGRIFGNLTTITSGIMPISFGLSGIIIDAVQKEVGLVFKGCGVVMLLITLALAFNKDVLKFYSKALEEDGKDPVNEHKKTPTMEVTNVLSGEL